MKLKLKRRQLLELNHVLKTTKFDLPINGRFRYMVTSNVKTTDEEIKQLNEAFPTPEKFVEFKKKEAEIYKTFGVAGQEALKTATDDIKNIVEDKLIELRSEYTDAINENDELSKERFSFLEENIEADLKTITPDDVPNISTDNKYYHWDIWNTLSIIVQE